MRGKPAARVARLVGAVVAFGAVACTPPVITDQGYEMVFHDDFEGTEANPWVWSTAPYGAPLPPTVEDGVLTLESTADNDYETSNLMSVGPRVGDEPSYPAANSWHEGYFEARIRYTDSPWTWAAFWTFSMAKSEAWPGEDCSALNAEWDIMENGIGNFFGDRPSPHSFFGVIHRNTTDGTSDGYCGQADDFVWIQESFPDIHLSDWHTWAGRWTDDELCYYLDDVELGCLPTYDSTAQPMHIVFSVQDHQVCGGCPAKPARLAMQIDWVRVWQQT